MTLLDFIIAGFAIFMMINGLIKGVLGQVFGAVGIVLVPFLTANLYALPMAWMEKLILDEGTRQLVALIATGAALFLLYKLLVKLLDKIIDKTKGLNLLNRVAGMLLGLLIVYASVGLLTSLLLNTGEGFLPLIKSLVKAPFENSWIVKNVYANNFLGDWIVQIIMEVFNKVVGK